MAARSLESTIARLLTVGTYLSIALVAVGSLLLIGSGRSPLEAAPPFDPAGVLVDVAALRPEGFLWLGIIAVLAAPATRVLVGLVGFGRAGEWIMVGVSGLILLVIAAGVIAGVAAG
jgi:uncharacterized membrane protein